MYRSIVPALVAVLLFAAPAAAHKGNPNFLTKVDAITPQTQGIDIEVINRDDSLELHNASGEDMVVEGYNKEPYARLDADGTVYVNTNSTAYYLNDDRFGDVPVPDGIDADSPPKWKELDKSSRFSWHDHRMHWMVKTDPPQIKGREDERTKIFDWKIPVTINGTPGDIAGELFWTPEPGTPVAFIVIGSIVVLGLSAVAIVFGRRRRAAELADDADAEPSSEAW